MQEILAVDDNQTIQKIILTILKESGFDGIVVGGAQEALAYLKEKIPSLMIIDTLMVPIDGPQFCQLLKEHDWVGRFPIIFISTKEIELPAAYKDEFQIVAVLKKPFTPTMLSHAVCIALGMEYKPYQVIVPHLPEQQDYLVCDPHVQKLIRDFHGDISEFISNSINKSISRITVDEKFTKEVYKEMQDKMIGVIMDLTGSITDFLSAKKLTGLAQKLSVTTESPMTDAMLEGKLPVFPIIDVFQLLNKQDLTGILTIWNEENFIEVYFRNGFIDFVNPRVHKSEFLLGRFLIEVGHVKPADISHAVDVQRESKLLLGKQMVQLGYISRDILKEGLKRQSKEILYDVIGWKQGNFKFMRLNVPLNVYDDSKLEMKIDIILSEGLEREREWSQILLDIGDDPIFNVDPESLTLIRTNKGVFTEGEIKVLDCINGESTVSSIVKKSNLLPFEVGKILYNFLTMKIVRKVGSIS